jgi:hypothetical protein
MTRDGLFHSPLDEGSSWLLPIVRGRVDDREEDTESGDNTAHKEIEAENEHELCDTGRHWRPRRETSEMNEAVQRKSSLDDTAGDEDAHMATALRVIRCAVACVLHLT